MRKYIGVGSKEMTKNPVWLEDMLFAGGYDYT